MGKRSKWGEEQRGNHTHSWQATNAEAWTTPTHQDKSNHQTKPVTIKNKSTNQFSPSLTAQESTNSSHSIALSNNINLSLPLTYQAVSPRVWLLLSRCYWRLRHARAAAKGQSPRKIENRDKAEEWACCKATDQWKLQGFPAKNNGEEISFRSKC